VVLHIREFRLCLPRFPFASLGVVRTSYEGTVIMKKATAIGIVASIALATGILAGCGAPAPEPVLPASTTAAPTEPVPPDETVTPTEPATTTGEIWQWALGRHLWSDPELDRYSRQLGVSWGQSTDAEVQSQGFELTADSSGTVTSVTLYNDEVGLGLPQSSTSYQAYQGDLPSGLTWSDTGSDVGAEYGTQTMGGYGSGLPLAFQYTLDDGHHATITFNAKTAEELSTAPMLSIMVGS
jgi:hypothetical protein